MHVYRIVFSNDLTYMYRTLFSNDLMYMYRIVISNDITYMYRTLFSNDLMYMYRIVISSNLMYNVEYCSQIILCTLQKCSIKWSYAHVQNCVPKWSLAQHRTLFSNDLIHINRTLFSNYLMCPLFNQKSCGLKFCKSRTGSHVTYSCHHNSSLFLSQYLYIRGVFLSSVRYKQ